MALSHLGSGSQRTRYRAPTQIYVDAKEPSADTREEFPSCELVLAEQGGDLLLRIGVAIGVDHASFSLRHPRKTMADRLCLGVQIIPMAGLPSCRVTWWRTTKAPSTWNSATSKSSNPMNDRINLELLFSRE